ncbi:MAG TPA: phage holin family protein [Candidatus Krumholzibacteria bacterium]|nr:phage holin family protein [Candidatus Krumholzibacteria bacterium]
MIREEEPRSRGERMTAGLGIIASIKEKLADALGATRSRVDVFQADVEHRLFRLLAMLIWGVVAFVSLSLGLLLAMLTVLFGFDLPPKYAFGIPALVFLAIGAVAVIMLRVKKASKYDREKHAKRSPHATQTKV